MWYAAVSRLLLYIRSRNNYHAISTQLAESDFDYFGGGHFSSAYDRRFDDGGSYKVAEDNGYTIAMGYDEYKANAESSELFERTQ